ncbi:MAG TPA: ABC transporter permease [Polyangiaceae bacterium]|nr:ABC transporter permease [Polyangiaceae bacterium]
MPSTLPYDPRHSYAPERSFLGKLGKWAIDLCARGMALAATLGGAVLSVRTPGIAAGNVVRRVLLNQIFYTGFQAVGLIGTIGVLLGATIVIQTELMVPSADAALIGKVLIAVVLRELSPLITAIVVAGRSGTAIATELGNMKVSHEILALASLGIDPPRFIVWPRLVAAVASVIVLMVYFAAVSLVGTAGVGILLANTSLGTLQSGLAAALTPYDLVLFLVKGAGLGTIVGWLSCHYGLEVKSSPTEVPQMASRAVVMSLLGCVAFNTLATALFYWTVGPPLR